MPRVPRDTASHDHPDRNRDVRRRRARPRRPAAPRAGRRGGRPRVGDRLGRPCSRCRSRWPPRSPRSASASPRPAAPPPTRAPRSARRAGAVTGWWFLCGVVLGAPAVALIGGAYVADLLGTGRAGAVVAAAGMMAVVMAANAAGAARRPRASSSALAGLLAALVLVAVLTALPESRADHWTPFAPHGWAAIGTAASLLMLSFIGWEAVSHLAGELRDPARQLPRAIFAALGIVVVLYLGLAVATVGVLGTARAVRRPARRPDGRRARRARPQRDRGARRAAHDGRDERVRGRRRQAGRRARRRGFRARRVRRTALGDPAVRRGRRARCWCRSRPGCSTSRP